MSNPQPTLRWRAAEVAAICMANNPPVQRWFMEGGALPRLMNMMTDADMTCQTKALLALSAMTRHYNPGLEAFRVAGGLLTLLQLAGLTDLLDSMTGHSHVTGSDDAITITAQPSTSASTTSTAQQDGKALDSQQQQQQEAGNEQEQEQQQQQQARSRLQRKALIFLQYMLAKHPADCIAAAQYGAGNKLAGLLQDPSSDVRQAALAVLLELAKHPDTWQQVRELNPSSTTTDAEPHPNSSGLLPCLQQMEHRYQGVSSEDQDAEREEVCLIQELAGVLAAESAPPQPPAACQDHVDLDPYQDGDRDSKTLALQPAAEQEQRKSERAGEQQHQQQPSARRESEANNMQLASVPYLP